MPGTNDYFTTDATTTTHEDWSATEDVVVMSQRLYAKHDNAPLDDRIDHPLGPRHSRTAQFLGLAHSEGELIGFSQAGGYGNAINLHSLWVEPDRRGSNRGPDVAPEEIHAVRVSRPRLHQLLIRRSNEGRPGRQR